MMHRLLFLSFITRFCFLSAVYPSELETSNFGLAKAPGLNDRILVNNSNIDQDTIVQPRELSHEPKSKFRVPLGIDLCEPLSLAEAVEVALENHPATTKAFANARRAAGAVGSAKSGYYPKLDLNLNIENGRNFQFIEGPDVTYTNVGANLILGMLLFDFGERSATVLGTEELLNAAHWQMDFAIQSVMIRVLENGYATLHAEEVLEGAEISLEEARRLYIATEDLVKAGLRSQSDLYTSQSSLLQMQMELFEQQGRLNIQKAKFAASLGICANTKVELKPIVEFPAGLPCAIDELICLATKQRADLFAKQAQVRQSAYQEKRIRASNWPKLSLYGRSGYNRYLENYNQGAQYAVGLNLDMPLFNGFYSSYQNRIALADKEMQMAELAELELDISLEVLSYSQQVITAQQTLEFAKKYVEAREMAYESTLDKYRVGKEGIFEVSSALRDLANARIHYSDVKTRLLIALSHLAYATGTMCPYMDSKC